MTKPIANRETEMKLSAPADDLERLWSALVTRSGATPGKQKLTNQYFDTPDGRLGALKISLRVREKNGQFLQTLKSAPEDGGFARGEWECPLPAPAKRQGGKSQGKAAALLVKPDLTLITDEAALQLLEGIGLEELVPVFTTRFERMVLLIESGEGEERAVIEAARDIGTITAPKGAEEAISEIELELVEGPVTALYDLALDLLAVAPFRIGSSSKAERGQKLATWAGNATGSLPVQAVGRSKIRLAADMSVDEGFARIITSCVGHLRANEDGACQASETDSLHQMRMALRSLRTAITLFGPMLPDETTRYFREEARWYGQQLGPARDWDVFQTELLPPIRLALSNGNPDQQKLVADLDALADLVAEQQRFAYSEVRETIASRRATEFTLRLNRWAETRGWRDGLPESNVAMAGSLADTLPARLRLLEKKARKAGADLADLDSEQRHDLHLLLKKLGLATSLFKVLLKGKPARKYQAALKRLQKTLGQMNDEATSARLLHQLAEDEALTEPQLACAAGLVIGWYTGNQPALEAKLHQRWTDFTRQKRHWQLGA